MLNFPVLLPRFADSIETLAGNGVLTPRFAKGFEGSTGAEMLLCDPEGSARVLQHPINRGGMRCATARWTHVSSANLWHGHASWPWVLGPVEHPAYG